MCCVANDSPDTFDAFYLYGFHWGFFIGWMVRMQPEPNGLIGWTRNNNQLQSASQQVSKQKVSMEYICKNIRIIYIKFHITVRLTRKLCAPHPTAATFCVSHVNGAAENTRYFCNIHFCERGANRANICQARQRICASCARAQTQHKALSSHLFIFW